VKLSNTTDVALVELLLPEVEFADEFEVPLSTGAANFTWRAL